jgi:predicted secreted hydrolase
MLMSWKDGKDLYLLILFLIVVALIKGYIFLVGGERAEGRGADGSEPGGSLSVASVMGGSPADSLFARVTGPRPFDFPVDHGPHPEYRTEWWYVTGNVEDETGRPFGFQFTVFRSALSPEMPEVGSAWATNQVYMGHLGVTDVQRGVHVPVERFARGAAGLAGGGVEPFRVWIDRWELASMEEGSSGPGPNGIFPLRLSVAEGEVGLDLVLEAGKGIVLQGESGYSQKGADPANASYYYSFPRMPVRGSVTVGGATHTVQGEAWLDREWSTSALDEGQVGWDWFALQFEGGEELMLYQLRGVDGSRDRLSRATWIDRTGTPRLLSIDEWTLEVLDEWASPVDGARYPARWKIEIPGEGVSLEVRPRVADQEMRVTIRYWEGSVEVLGEGRQGAVRGRGFVELTGYADPIGESRGAAGASGSGVTSGRGG